MTDIKLEPCGDWILVKTTSVERTSASGLVLPAVSMPEDEGVVVAVGPEVKRCVAGERICFGKARSTQKGGEHHYLVKDEDVIAKVIVA
jgi:co-chaperonin GroES (HSP10)